MRPHTLISDDITEPTTVLEYGILPPDGEVTSGFLEDSSVVETVRDRDDLTLACREVIFSPWRTVPQPKVQKFNEFRRHS